MGGAEEERVEETGAREAAGVEEVKEEEEEEEVEEEVEEEGAERGVILGEITAAAESAGGTEEPEGTGLVVAAFDNLVVVCSEGAAAG